MLFLYYKKLLFLVETQVKFSEFKVIAELRLQT